MMAAILQAYDLEAGAALGGAAGVERGGALADLGGERVVADFEPPQQLLSGAAEPQDVVRGGLAAQFLVGPFVDRAAVGADDAQRCVRELDQHVAPRARHAVEIDALRRRTSSR